MKGIRQFLMVLAAVVGFFSALSFSQSETGIPPFSSFGGGFDKINLSNLNIHLEIPIVSKAGRGLPFNYALAFDNSFWTTRIITVDHHPEYAWEPRTKLFGWIRQTDALGGYMLAGIGHLGCGDIYAYFTYYDRRGTAHTF